MQNEITKKTPTLDRDSLTLIKQVCEKYSFDRSEEDDSSLKEKLDGWYKSASLDDLIYTFFKTNFNGKIYSTNKCFELNEDYKRAIEQKMLEAFTSGETDFLIIDKYIGDVCGFYNEDISYLLKGLRKFTADKSNAELEKFLFEDVVKNLGIALRNKDFASFYMETFQRYVETTDPDELFNYLINQRKDFHSHYINGKYSEGEDIKYPQISVLADKLEEVTNFLPIKDLKYNSILSEILLLEKFPKLTKKIGENLASLYSQKISSFNDIQDVILSFDNLEAINIIVDAVRDSTSMMNLKELESFLFKDFIEHHSGAALEVEPFANLYMDLLNKYFKEASLYEIINKLEGEGCFYLSSGLKSDHEFFQTLIDRMSDIADSTWHEKQSYNSVISRIASIDSSFTERLAAQMSEKKALQKPKTEQKSLALVTENIKEMVLEHFPDDKNALVIIDSLFKPEIRELGTFTDGLKNENFKKLISLQPEFQTALANAGNEFVREIPTTDRNSLTLIKKTCEEASFNELIAKSEDGSALKEKLDGWYKSASLGDLIHTFFKINSEGYVYSTNECFELNEDYKRVIEQKMLEDFTSGETDFLIIDSYIGSVRGFYNEDISYLLKGLREFVADKSSAELGEFLFEDVIKNFGNALKHEDFTSFYMDVFQRYVETTDPDDLLNYLVNKRKGFYSFYINDKYPQLSVLADKLEKATTFLPIRDLKDSILGEILPLKKFPKLNKKIGEELTSLYSQGILSLDDLQYFISLSDNLDIVNAIKKSTDSMNLKELATFLFQDVIGYKLGIALSASHFANLYADLLNRYFKDAPLDEIINETKNGKHFWHSFYLKGDHEFLKTLSERLSDVDDWTWHEQLPSNCIFNRLAKLDPTFMEKSYVQILEKKVNLFLDDKNCDDEDLVINLKFKLYESLEKEINVDQVYKKLLEQANSKQIFEILNNIKYQGDLKYKDSGYKFILDCWLKYLPSVPVNEQIELLASLGASYKSRYEMGESISWSYLWHYSGDVQKNAHKITSYVENIIKQAEDFNWVNKLINLSALEAFLQKKVFNEVVIENTRKWLEKDSFCNALPDSSDAGADILLDFPTNQRVIKIIRENPELKDLMGKKLFLHLEQNVNDLDTLSNLLDKVTTTGDNELFNLIYESFDLHFVFAEKIVSFIVESTTAKEISKILNNRSIKTFINSHDIFQKELIKKFDALLEDVSTAEEFITTLNFAGASLFIRQNEELNEVVKNKFIKLFEAAHDKETVFNILTSTQFSRYFADHFSDITSAIKEHIPDAIDDISDAKEAQQLLWKIVEISIDTIKNRAKIAKNSDLNNELLNQQNFWQQITPPLLYSKSEQNLLDSSGQQRKAIGSASNEDYTDEKSDTSPSVMDKIVTQNDVSESVKKHLGREESMEKNVITVGDLIKKDIVKHVLAGGFDAKSLSFYQSSSILQEAANYCLKNDISEFSYPYLTGITEAEEDFPLSLIDCNYALLASRTKEAKAILDRIEVDRAIFKISFFAPKDGEEYSPLGQAINHRVEDYKEIQVNDINNLPTLMHEMTHAYMFHIFDSADANPYAKDDKEGKKAFDEVMYKVLKNCYIKYSYDPDLIKSFSQDYSPIEIGKLISAVQKSFSMDLSEIAINFKSAVNDYEPSKFHAEFVVRHFQLSVDPSVDQDELAELETPLAEYIAKLLTENEGLDYGIANKII